MAQCSWAFLEFTILLAQAPQVLQVGCLMSFSGILHLGNCTREEFLNRILVRITSTNEESKVS